MMRVMAIAMEISPEELNEIRSKCIQDVKKSNGSLSFQNVMKEERESEK